MAELEIFDAAAVAEVEDRDKLFPPFPWKGLDGQVYYLPNIKILTGRTAQRIQEGDPSVMAELLDEDAFEAMQELPIHVQESMASAWISHGGEPGKSSSRSPKKKTTGTRRKRT